MAGLAAVLFTLAGTAPAAAAPGGAADRDERPGKGNGRNEAPVARPAATPAAATTEKAATPTPPAAAATPTPTAKAEGGTVSTASAHGLSITTITWDIVGLDSTDVDDGPNVYPVGVRVCATGGTVEGITVSFTWLSANPYLNLVGPATQTIPSLAAGTCVDRYFFVAVTRDEAAYDTTRAYSVTATATNGTIATTPTPRQLYVERLLSQNRNTVLGISGPTTVYEGDTVTYTVEASTAPNGYSQLDVFLTMLDPLFSLSDVQVSYETPAGTTINSPYADACGWEPDPSSPDYRECVGPARIGSGSVGGTIVGTYTGTVVGLGDTTMSTAIIDVSGSSYHYNSDFGIDPNLIFVTSLPSADLALTKTALGSFVAGETARYQLTVLNQGPSASGALTITDPLPAGMTYVSAVGTGWSCSGGTTVTCARSTTLAAGSSSTVVVTVRLADSLAGTTVNTATVTGPGRDIDTADNTDSATATVVAPAAARGGSTGARASRGEAARTVGVADEAQSSTAIAVTGSNSAGPLTAFALLLIGVGAAARRAGRRLHVTPAQ